MTRLRGFCSNPEQTGDRMASRQVFFENIEFAPTDEIKIFCFIAYGCAFYNRNELGQSATCCMDARSLQARYKGMFRLQTKQRFISRSSQSKIKETRGSLLSTGFYIAIELNKRSGISLWFTVAQSTLGNIASIYVQTL